MEKYIKDALKISDLYEYYENIESEPLNEILTITNYILDSYNSDGNFYYDTLHCEDYEDKERNKKVREYAKKQIKLLKAYLKKYQ